jgi:hypothetical protein
MSELTDMLESIRLKSKAQRGKQTEWEIAIAALDLEKDVLAAQLNELSKSLSKASAL